MFLPVKQVIRHSLLSGFCLLPLLAVAEVCLNNPLNDYQWLGSHNSYKQQLPDSWYQQAEQRGFATQPIRYGHPALTTQLEIGLRHLEIDLLADPQGGAYATPLMAQWLQQSGLQQPVMTAEQQQQLLQPGIKVMHMPDIDFASYCLLLTDCLQQLAAWSVQHPQHLPVVILFNVKETGIIGGVVPPTWQAADYAAAEKVIAEVLGSGRILKADDVRHAAPQNGLGLRGMLQHYGWPPLHQALGKFILLFDGQPQQFARYEQQFPGQRGSLFFASFDASHPDAAIVLRNQPQAALDDIAQLAAQNLLIRTRSDDGNIPDRQRFEIAQHSSANIISTDFYPGAPQGTPQQQLTFPGDTFFRLKPGIQCRE